MSKESAQAALGKFAEVVNTGNFDLFDQVVDPNCVDHDPADGQVRGPAGYRMFFSGMRTALPDMRVIPLPDMSVILETIVQDEDTIPFAYTLTGTHTGPLERSRRLARRSRSAACRSPNSKTARWSNVGEAPTS